MKKIMIFLLAFGLLSACKSKENSKDDKTENISKDKIDKKTDDVDEDGNKKSDIESINGQDDNEKITSWPEVERKGFVSSCVRQAVNGGMDRSKATTYCECMLEKMETKYPDIQDAAKLTENDISELMTKDAAGCLGKN